MDQHFRRMTFSAAQNPHKVRKSDLFVCCYLKKKTCKIILDTLEVVCYYLYNVNGIVGMLPVRRA